MTFRDQDEKDLTNEFSSLSKKLGNVTKETENYYELKFKHASQLAEMNEIDFDKLKNLIFQTEISYKNVKGGKYIRVITKNLIVSDNKEEINKVANMNIVSTLQIQKSAKLAGKGDLMEAQAQIHIARNFLDSNKFSNMNNIRIFNQFNNNINSLHSNLNMINSNEMINNNMNNMMNMNNNTFNNNMINNNMMNMNNNIFNNNIFNNNMNNHNMMNMNNNIFNNNMNNHNMMNMNNNTFNNNMINMNYHNMMNMNNNMMNNNMGINVNRNMNLSNDNLHGLIYSLSHTSENRQNQMFSRSSDFKINK